MKRNMGWIMLAFLFVDAAGFSLFVFTCLLLQQQVTLGEPSILVNRVEFAWSLGVFLLAIWLFAHYMRKLLKGDRQ